MPDIARYCPRCISAVAQRSERSRKSLCYIVLSWHVPQNITELPKVNKWNSDIYKGNAPEVLVSTRHWPKPRADLNWCALKTDHLRSPLPSLSHFTFLFWVNLPHSSFVCTLYFPISPSLLARTDESENMQAALGLSAPGKMT